MRGLLPLLMVLLAIGSILSGCDPNSNPIEVTPPVSEEDAATVIGAALAGSQSTGGLTAQIQEIVLVAKAGPISKISATAEPQADTTIVLVKGDGLYTYNYMLHLSYAFASANLLQVEFSMKGVYDTPRTASNDSCGGAIDVTNILAGDVLTFNGTYDRYGTQQFKNENQDAFQSTVNARLANVNVSKATALPVSGTITFNIALIHSSGASVEFVAVVTFNSDETATITVNAKTFTVNLITGVVLPV
jgi:hypothetical protein